MAEIELVPKRLTCSLSNVGQNRRVEMSQAEANSQARHQQNREVLYSLGLLVVSGVLVSLLDESRWIVPITLAHVGALAVVLKGFHVPGFRNVATKTSFLVLAAFATVFALAAGASTSRSEGDVLTEIATRNPAGVDQAPQEDVTKRPVPTIPQKLPEAEIASKPPTATAGSRSTMRTVSTTVDEIVETYAKNQIAGDRKYSGVAISIAGRAVRVREAFGTGILVLKSPRSNNELELYFAEEGEPSLAEVAPGKSVTADCRSITEMMGALVLGDCRSVR